MFKLLIVFYSLFYIVSLWADPRKDTKHPCAPDFPKFCAKEVPSDVNYWGCLGKNMNMLSNSCLEFMKVNVYLKLNPCGEDVLKFCSGDQMNYGNWTFCLAKKRTEVSEKCNGMLTKLDKRTELRLKIAKICKAERNKLCADLDVRQCVGIIVRSNPKELSQDCRYLVKELENLL
jgi:hypothetical protein